MRKSLFREQLQAARTDQRAATDSSGDLSRRRLLTGAAALGLSELLLKTQPLAADTAKPRAKTIIDFHLHFAGASAPARAGRSNMPAGRQTNSAQKVLDMMDEGGVVLGMLSQPTVGVGPDMAANISACRTVNESMAKTVADYPDRFGMFASLPLPDVDASLKEMEYAMGTLKANGVHLLTSYQGTLFLGDPKFDPLFEELNRRKIIVKTHPAADPCCQAISASMGVAGGLVELGTDTMRAIGRMLFSGSAEKFKDVPIIWSHAGGSMVALLQRFPGEIENHPEMGKAVPNGPEYYLKRFYYDVAQAYHPVTLRALKSFVPMSQILFGTDYGFQTALQTIEGIEKSGAFNAQELRALENGNGRKLLGMHA